MESDLKKSIQVGTVKSILGVLPFVGPLLDEVFFEIQGRVKTERFHKFVFELKSEMENLSSISIDKEYILSEDFYDIINSSFQKSLTTSLKIKHSALAKLIKESIVNKWQYEEDLVGLFIRMVEELTINHLIIFKFL